jgi:type III secretory pathway component EscS
MVQNDWISHLHNWNTFQTFYIHFFLSFNGVILSTNKSLNKLQSYFSHWPYKAFYHILFICLPVELSTYRVTSSIVSTTYTWKWLRQPLSNLQKRTRQSPSLQISVKLVLVFKQVLLLTYSWSVLHLCSFHHSCEGIGTRLCQ